MARLAVSQGNADVARSWLTDAVEKAIRDDSWALVATGLDTAVDTFWYLGEARATAILAGAVETTLARLRWPYVASRGLSVRVRNDNLTGLGKRWEKYRTSRPAPEALP
jgi:hypothetical protein